MTDQSEDANDHHNRMAREAEDAFNARIGNLRWAYLARGAVFLVLGLIALFWPSGSVSLMLRIFGFFLLLDGALFLWGVRRTGARFGELVPSLVTAIVGLALLLLPTASIKLAFVLLGLWAIVTGLSYLLAWWRMPVTYPERDSSRNTGIVVFLIGIVLVLWPGTGPVALGWTLAVVALVISAIMFYLASGLKSVTRSI